MTKQEKRALYENIMRDVAKVVKRHILEYSDDVSSASNSTLTKVMQWLDDVDKRTRQMMSDEALAEALEPDFNANVSTLLSELQRWFTSDNRTYVIPRHREIIKNVEFFLTPENIRLSDIVVYDPNHEFVKIIDDFMAQRDYKMMMYKVRDDDEYPDSQLLHIVYCPLEQIEVDVADATDYIYHLTPVDNVSDIMTNGFQLTSRHGEDGIYYDSRTYFFLYEDNADAYESFLSNAYNKDMAKIKLPVGNVAGVKFYRDPLLMNSNSIYTETQITNTAGATVEEYHRPDYMHVNISDEDAAGIVAYFGGQ